MARTSRAEVERAIDTTLTADQIDDFVNDANAWVTDFLANEGLSSARLKIIEKYLACHFVTLRDPRLRSGSIGGSVTETYQRDTEVTEYLKAAIAQDPTGIVKGRFLKQDEGAEVRFRIGVYDDAR